MHIAKFLVPHCLHKTFNIKKLWICAICKMLIHANFSFLKHPLFLVVHWSSNKGQIPACPGQHAEDIKFSWDLAAITQSAQLCYCQTRDSTTSNSLCPCPAAPNVEQDWCCTAKGKWAHSPPRPGRCAHQPPQPCGNDKPIRSTNYFRSKWECDPRWRQSQSEQKRPEDTWAVGAFWSEIFKETFHCEYVHFSLLTYAHVV